MIPMRLLTVIALSCVLAWTGCAAKTKPYERHVQTAYDEQGKLRHGYATLNVEFLEALWADLEACYADKKP